MGTIAAVKGVNQRNITTKDGRSSTVYEIIDSNDNKWQTFKQPIANEANRLIGQQAEFDGRVEQNGQWTNYYLDGIRAAQNGPVQRDSYAPAQQAQQSQAKPDQGWGHEPWTEKDWNIMRQTAGKVSAQISQGPHEFWSNLAPILAYFAYGTMPAEHSPQARPAQQTQSSEPQPFIPDGSVDPSWSPNGLDNPDSDIPF